MSCGWEMRRAYGRRRPAALRLMTHPGVGVQTALATVLTLGEVSRFHSARAVSAYLGWCRASIVPAASSGWGTSASRGRA